MFFKIYFIFDAQCHSLLVDSCMRSEKRRELRKQHHKQDTEQSRHPPNSFSLPLWSQAAPRP